MGQQIAVVVLSVVDPARRAGSDHREFAAVLNTAQQLGAFFHNGQVSSKVGVINLVEAQTLQRGHHFTGNRSTDGHTELFAQRSTDSRSGLHHNMLTSLESCVNLADLGLLHQSAGGANTDTLAALDAGRVQERAVLSRSNNGVETTILESKDTHILTVGILAASNTATAQNALGSVTDDSGREFVISGLGLAALVATLTGTGDTGHMQQFALAVLITLLAVDVMIGKQQFYGSTAGFGSLGAGDDDLHTLADGVNTGSNQTSCAHHFNQADTAGTVVALTVIKCTQRGNFVATLFGSFQDGQALFHLIGNAFDLNIYHFSFPPYFFTIAFSLQVAIHAPHLTHFMGSIW